MVAGNKDALIEALRDVAGDAFRLAATYDEDGYDVIYARADAVERAEGYADRVHDELILQGLGRGYLEDLFGAGNLECSIHRFEELTAFHFATGEFSGLFVSVDSAADLRLATFAETCKEHL